MRVLVAGLGNIFFGDDGFGVEVVRQFAARARASEVRVMDIGIRSIDLGFALLEGWDLALLIDATARGHAPGTLYVLDLDEAEALPRSTPIDGHALHPDGVLAAVRAAGARIERLRMIGCEPARLLSDDQEPLLGLSDAVQAAVPRALELVDELLSEVLAGSAETSGDRLPGRGEVQDA